MNLDEVISTNYSTIIFLHVPKTAGTNISNIIWRNYRRSCFLDTDEYKWINKKTKTAKCYIDHFSWQACFKENNAICFTMLRDPIERVISHYVECLRSRYIDGYLTLNEIFLEKPDLYFPQNGNIDDETAHRVGIKKPNEIALWYSNFYCRFFSGTSFLGTQPQIVTKDLCDFVINNINQNKVIYSKDGRSVEFPLIVGITERFDETIKMFAKVAKWKTTKYEEQFDRAKGFRKKYVQLDISNELITEIEKRNSLDIEIYKAALNVFEKQLEAFGIK